MNNKIELIELNQNQKEQLSHIGDMLRDEAMEIDEYIMRGRIYTEYYQMYQKIEDILNNGI